MAKIMKFIAYTVIIICAIVGLALWIKYKNIWLFIIFGGVAFVNFIQWLVLVEISEKIDYISEQLLRTESRIASEVNKNSTVSNTRGYLSSYLGSNSNEWICSKCGEKNPSSQRICKGCGREK